MRITKEKLEVLGACSVGIDTFVRQFPSGAELTEAVEWCISTGENDNLQYASWLVAHLFDKTQAVRYAVFAADQVIGLFERRYPKDARPRKAIEAAKARLEKPGEEIKRGPSAAALAVYAAASARSAALAAYADADVSADASAEAACACADAADAAYARSASVYAACADAAYVAAAASADATRLERLERLEMKTRILRYGLTLCTKGLA